MQSSIILVFLASVAHIIVTVVGFPPLPDDVYMFLPFLRHYQPPPPCPVNELYTTCTGKCSDCVQRGKCTITTCLSDCDCAPRFYRVTPGGPCEPVANCPKPECGENEVFRECGPICERCTTMACRVIQCDHKCYCKEGYLRNSDGICIPQEECPKRKRCTSNEQWADSGSADEFCPSMKNQTLEDEVQEVSQCYCKDGFKRNALGNCINATLCSLIQCSGVENYYSCIPKCNTTCRNYGNPDCVEDDNCFPGCFCPPGYVMNDFRACIPQHECSLDIDQVKVIDGGDYGEDEESNNETTTATSLDDADNSTIVQDLEENTESSYNTSWTLETEDSTVTESSIQDMGYRSTLSDDNETSDYGQSQSFAESEASGTSENGQSQAYSESEADGTSENNQSQAFSESEANGTSENGQSQAYSESKANGTSENNQSQAFSESKADGTSENDSSEALAQSETNGSSESIQSQASAVSDNSGNGQSQAFSLFKSGGIPQLEQPPAFTMFQSGDTSGLAQSQAFAGGTSAQSQAFAGGSSAQSQAFAHSAATENSGVEQSQAFAQGYSQFTGSGTSQSGNSQAFAVSRTSGIPGFGQLPPFTMFNPGSTSELGQSQALAGSEAYGTSGSGGSQVFAQAQTGENSKFDQSQAFAESKAE